MYAYKLSTVTLIVGLCGELHHVGCQNFTAVGPSGNQAEHSLFVCMQTLDILTVLHMHVRMYVRTMYM